jgi:succinate dehydrogenase/fumarate reductase flavoprotein subunit
MTTWHQYIQKNPTSPEWPYPIRYDKENEIETDVLVIGGGIAGCHAAINAARKGVKVAVLEKGMTKRSGAGGAGVDHWLGACTNPCSKVTPEEYARTVTDAAGGYTSGHARYIHAMEGWDTLLDCEQMGVRIRDVEDEFKGADFRDDETKLMFAYDYENRIHIRVWGHNIKPMLYKEMKRLGVNIYDRVMVTSLLTEGGRQGARVVGATGFNVRTGEFHIFKSKAAIMSTAGATIGVSRLWFFAPELVGSGAMGEMNNACVGQAIGWNAGAEFVIMEQTPSPISGLGYAPYSMGNSGNTYYGAPMVDADGKLIPWVDKNRKELKTLEDRFKPGEGHKFMLGEGIGLFASPQLTSNHPVGDIPERLLKGELKLPFYADLTQMPEHERRVIFGMMVGNEGKTRIPIYDTFTKAGFDPDKDMMLAPIMHPNEYRRGGAWAGRSFAHLRGIAGGGFLVDWNLKTSLDGLYAAGKCIFGSGNHGFASSTGRYAGMRAAEYAMTASEPVIHREQVDAEKNRIYAPLKHSKQTIGWKELNIGIARVMQDYCSPMLSDETLNLGVNLLNEIRETEAEMTYAGNPHELGRLLECFALISVGELVMHSSLVRKASSALLSFQRLDYPEVDPPEWQKFIPIRLEDNKVKIRDLPLDYYLKPPYAPTFDENYKKHADK